MKYSTVSRKRKGFAVASLIVLILAAAVVLIIEARHVKPAWDIELPMANANVNWKETFYPGSWGE